LLLCHLPPPPLSPTGDIQSIGQRNHPRIVWKRRHHPTVVVTEFATKLVNVILILASPIRTDKVMVRFVTAATFDVVVKTTPIVFREAILGNSLYHARLQNRTPLFFVQKRPQVAHLVNKLVVVVDQDQFTKVVIIVVKNGLPIDSTAVLSQC
jgi:hypothetical protein